MRNSNVPKTVARAIEQRRGIIESYHMEQDGMGGPGNEWSVWVYLKPGYVCVHSETGSIHECTAADAVMAIRDARRAKE